MNKERKLQLKEYQRTLFRNSINRNSIVYLPTGAGKTLVSILAMYYYLCKLADTKKIIFLANTIQLVKQQTEVIKRGLRSIIQNPGLRGEIYQLIKSQGHYSADILWSN